jgi:hypothetical protein
MRRGWAAALTAALALGGCTQREPEPARSTDTTRLATSPATTAVPASAPASSIDRNTLKGGWSPDGEMFAMSVEDSTILFEFDMKNHPYQLRGDTLIIDFQDPTLGVQKKLLLKLTPDTLVIKDIQYDATDTLIRVKQ